MKLRVVAVIEIDATVKYASHIEDEFRSITDLFSNDKRVTNSVVGTVKQGSVDLKSVDNVTFRSSTYDPYTGKRKEDKNKNDISKSQKIN